MNANLRHKALYAAGISMCFCLAGCEQRGQSDLLTDMARIRAIDNHAHPVRVTAADEQDREFDALPVDYMEPSSDPVNMRPGPDGAPPGVLDAWRALYTYSYGDSHPEHRRELTVSKTADHARTRRPLSGLGAGPHGRRHHARQPCTYGARDRATAVPVGALCRCLAVPAGQFASGGAELGSQGLLRG
jgi:hypothetical protein